MSEWWFNRGGGASPRGDIPLVVASILVGIAVVSIFVNIYSGLSTE